MFTCLFFGSSFGARPSVGECRLNALLGGSWDLVRKDTSKVTTCT